MNTLQSMSENMLLLYTLKTNSIACVLQKRMNVHLTLARVEGLATTL